MQKADRHRVDALSGEPLCNGVHLGFVERRQHRAVDLHAPQIEGFFHIPVDSLTAVPALCEALKPRLPPDPVVVAPDAGRVKMATRYAERVISVMDGRIVDDARLETAERDASDVIRVRGEEKSR